MYRNKYSTSGKQGVCNYSRCKIPQHIFKQQTCRRNSGCQWDVFVCWVLWRIYFMCQRWITSNDLNSYLALGCCNPPQGFTPHLTLKWHQNIIFQSSPLIIAKKGIIKKKTPGAWCIKLLARIFFRSPSLLDRKILQPPPPLSPRKIGVNPTKNLIDSIYRGKLCMIFSDFLNFKDSLASTSPTYMCLWRGPLFLLYWNQSFCTTWTLSVAYLLSVLFLVNPT